MNFAVADAVPYDRLNVILWHSVHTEAPPPVVRSGFALRLGSPAPEDDDDH
jgi:hypothetical protein